MGHRVTKTETLHKNPLQWVEEQRRIISKLYRFIPSDEDFLATFVEYRDTLIKRHILSRLTHHKHETIRILIEALEDKIEAKNQKELDDGEMEKIRSQTLEKLKKLH